MIKSDVPDHLVSIFDRVRDTLKDLSSASSTTPATSNFLFKAAKSTASELLPPYYIVYFLLVDIAKLRDIGRFEKIAWSVPIEYREKAFLIEHRKSGVGIFVDSDCPREDDARRLAILIQKAAKYASPYFDWLAENAIFNSEINVNNRCINLFQRYQYFLRLHGEEKERASSYLSEYQDAKNSPKLGSYVEHLNKYYQYSQCGNWLAMAAIDAWYSWTEHLFVHLAIVGGSARQGNEVTRLISAEWQEKFKLALSIENRHIKKYFDDLALVRQQLRNYVAHGAFGKQGEAFRFHSAAGSVPVMMPHRKKNIKYGLVGDANFDEQSVLILLEKFTDYLNTDKIGILMYHCQESGMPSILTYALDGTYERARQSIDSMREFTDYLSREIDNSANMDW